MHSAQTKTAPHFRRTTETLRAGAKTLPQRYFVSPEIFAEELQKIFATNWVLVGHQSQLAKPGDYFLTEVAGVAPSAGIDAHASLAQFCCDAFHANKNSAAFSQNN